MNAYLYFCWICVAAALGLIFACAVDYSIESAKHGKHEMPRWDGKRGAK